MPDSGSRVAQFVRMVSAAQNKQSPAGRNHSKDAGKHGGAPLAKTLPDNLTKALNTPEPVMDQRLHVLLTRQAARRASSASPRRLYSLMESTGSGGPPQAAPVAFFVLGLRHEFAPHLCFITRVRERERERTTAAAGLNA